VFLIDLKGVPNGGTARKTEFVNLMNLADPFDLNAVGQTVFTFPYTTIENVVIRPSDLPARRQVLSLASAGREPPRRSQATALGSPKHRAAACP
jgi:hypothetical protein